MDCLIYRDQVDLIVAPSENVSREGSQSLTSPRLSQNSTCLRVSSVVCIPNHTNTMFRAPEAKIYVETVTSGKIHSLCCSWIGTAFRILIMDQLRELLPRRSRFCWKGDPNAQMRLHPSTIVETVLLLLQMWGTNRYGPTVRSPETLHIRLLGWGPSAAACKCCSCRCGSMQFQKLGFPLDSTDRCTFIFKMF